jgi:flavorubredoxin
METSVTEVASGIYRLSTYVEAAGLPFNQYLVVAEEPVLFHTGLRQIFPLVRDAVSRVIPVDRIRWISYGHHEADESGAMNDWLDAAPRARVAVSGIGVIIAARDLCLREPRSLEDGETLELGGKTLRFLATPHVPHGWDAGLLYEETTATLLCGDLFTQMGDNGAVTGGDIVGPAFAAEDTYGATALTPRTAPTLRRLAELQPRTLGLMHGPAFQGDGAAALRDLADGYEQRFSRMAQTG